MEAFPCSLFDGKDLMKDRGTGDMSVRSRLTCVCCRLPVEFINVFKSNPMSLSFNAVNEKCCHCGESPCVVLVRTVLVRIAVILP